MNPFARWLDRLARARAEAIAPRQTQARDTDKIAENVDRTLASAGLDRPAGSANGIRATIERALAQTGLLRQRPAAADRNVVDPAAIPDARGEFVDRSFSNQAGTRAYKLYVPVAAGHAGARLPLIVMLHGCTQTADDFAAGTRMNALAEVHGFLVAYPVQAARDNGARCWNWFRSEDQRRESGEPSLIAGIARAVASDYRIDERRVFVAGLSAGAAMAVILGQTYPDVFAAVGAHSGLPFGAAHDASSAFAAMKGGADMAGLAGRADRSAAVREGAGVAMPTIVFHGSADRTVDPRNGLAIVHDATSAVADPARLQASNYEGQVEGGRDYTREVFAERGGRAIVELWIVHGAGHAWSGGSAQGTYTDPSGPDASAEMIRFFLQRKDGRS